MTFGEKLRQLRQERKLTQPDLAEAMGIEQSYLSKLENGKSLPSNDVFKRILDVFDIDVGMLVDDLDQGARNQLRQIPDVGDHLSEQKQIMIGNRRRWLLVSSSLAALGAALIYTGHVHLFFPNVVYQYMSHGVVLEGEPMEIFREQNPPLGLSQEERDRYRYDLYARTDKHYIQSEEYAGELFNKAVEGGSRTYYLRGDTEIDPWQNKAVTAIGLLMLVFGSIGIVLERKLSATR